MRRLFALDQGATENVAFLAPAQGNFNGATTADAHPWDTSTGPSPDNPDAPSTDPMAVPPCEGGTPPWIKEG
jgi:hypothetical protein